jgi:hypothetical protein
MFQQPMVRPQPVSSLPVGVQQIQPIVRQTPTTIALDLPKVPKAQR